jgi:hypothetical protein
MKYAIIENGVVTNIAMADGPLFPNWVETSTAGIGWTYSNGVFAAPAIPEPPVVVDPCEWFIDLGPFYDRFGAAKMAVLTSADAGVKAIVGDTNIRKWIDLERADVASGLAYIGSVVPELTPALQTAILTTPVTAEENMALRKLYFR